MAVAPAGERLILVGHSFGGLSIALAMERFPDKIAMAVFAASSMPCVGKHMGIVREVVSKVFFRTKAKTLPYYLL